MGDMLRKSFDEFEYCERHSDWHGMYSIQLGELIEGGFDPFGDPDWQGLDWYNDETRTRLEGKVVRRFRYRDIGIVPPGPWRQELTRVAGEVLPKLKPLYQALAEGISPLADTDEYGKERHVYSQFPATQLDANVYDYASTADDRQYEKVVNGDYLDKALQIYNSYVDVDAAFLDSLEVCFSCLITANINGL